MILAYHIIFTTHGFWLPNDPRGSSSTAIRVEKGEITTGARGYAGLQTIDFSK